MMILVFGQARKFYLRGVEHVNKFAREKFAISECEYKAVSKETILNDYKSIMADHPEQ